MDTEKLFRELTGFEPYDYQLRAWEKIREIMNNGGKVIIEVPTAGGKTETAVMPFFAGIYNNNWPVARLVYVLPTRSLVEKQAERLRNLVYKLLQLKGKSKEEAEKLARELVVVEYGLEKTHAFLGWVVVTTWDAFLYGLAAHRTVGNRFTFPAGAIAQSLVIFDEVQMYQDESMYMPRLLSLVVGILEEANVPLVIMSATIPSKLREMIAGDTEVITVDKNDKNKPSRGNVKVRLVEGDITDVLNDIKKILKNGKKVLVVRNTVRKAVETYQVLKKKLNDTLANPSDALLIHSRFTIGDRREKERALDSARLIVATQVVEAGLDLPNVGLVVTDIAPLDALIQRIGRCARRPGEEGEGIILIPVENCIEHEKIVRGLSELMEKIGEDTVVFATVTSTNEYDRVVEIHYGEGKKNFVYVGDIDTARRVLEKKRSKKLPKDLYIIPYSVSPYDPLVLLTTYDELSKIGEYLADTTKARKALDRVYKFHYENNIVPKEFASAYIYFKELKLFSAPPEYELRSRPELYVLLYPMNIEKNERVEDKVIDNLETARIIRISYSVKEWKKSDVVIGRLMKEWDKNAEKWVWKVRKSFKIDPYEIYVIDAKYYNSELGFITNLSDTNSHTDSDSKVRTRNSEHSSKKNRSKGKKGQTSLENWGVRV
ncbi:CRISPR-associated helicase Cas3' [Pyrococcus furiosus DSM 3638]|uniref:CRISPR-associated helicase Cas3 n=3 Tax=Pyrococcus furiosus TaxID=2261 RepID=A0A5C0XNV5_PYRFU|nr:MULTISPECIES: CRISPR-associated helicase Cas3' [Pyrococcus]AAL80764.1 ATP-dependent RNA helicase, putative [Pyrococcus furiosus DSM 3638]AFN03429.1 ATP-dependent RNA helicase [Pyrococcus furiosus COM1]MDK2869607.1 CRISPR-associated endonuclease/helicase Cas3 [Pyrococcus sp.]QEK78341.1 CRISPR-associated helicase Cas3' [Pyrococcus furiosus DSM 3638]